MNHPSELLPDFLDGTLDEGDRALVEAHVRTCETCRADLAAAAAGREAIRSLPPAVPPPDLRDRIVAATGRAEPASPSRYRWAPIAAAAAVVVALALTLPNLGSPGGERAAEEEAPRALDSAAGGGAASSEGVPLESRDIDYGGDDLSSLAGSAGAGPLGPVPAAAEAGSRAGADDALDCVVRSYGAAPPGRLVRLIRARVDGDPSYLAVYEERPGTGGDLGVVYVTSIEGCRFVSVTQARL